MKKFKLGVSALALGLQCLTPMEISAQEKSGASKDSLTKKVASTKEETVISKKLSITGYLQPQFQHIDSAGAPSAAGGDFMNGTGIVNNRFMLRRGRIKFTYVHNAWSELVINPDITEKGLFMRETYVKFSDPVKKIFSVVAGLYVIQFGHEVVTSSSSRETPERARVFQALFPTERDLGLLASVAAPKESRLRGLRMDVAVLNGVSGVNPEFDNKKDFCGRVQYTTLPNDGFSGFGIGASIYQGGYRPGVAKDYQLKESDTGDMGYVLNPDSTSANRLAGRNYVGVDVQFSIHWFIGTTSVRAEYVQGHQPGTGSSSASPKAAPSGKLFYRQFNGACFYWIQNIGTTKFQLVGKYDWYDPNISLSGLQVGKHGTATSNAGDIRFDTYGVGLNYLLDKNIKISCYYDYVMNEKTSITAYKADIKDNVFTTRIQFKF